MKWRNAGLSSRGCFPSAGRLICLGFLPAADLSVASEEGESRRGGCAQRRRPSGSEPERWLSGGGPRRAAGGSGAPTLFCFSHMTRWIKDATVDMTTVVKGLA